MKNTIPTKGKIRPPFSIQEAEAMEGLVEILLANVAKFQQEGEQVALRHFADDLCDILIDIKVDINNYIKEATDG